MGLSGRWSMYGFEVGIGRFCFGEWGLGWMKGLVIPWYGMVW